MDYIFRVLGYEYLGRTDFLQVQPGDLPASASDALADMPPIAPLSGLDDDEDELEPAPAGESPIAARPGAPAPVAPGAAPDAVTPAAAAPMGVEAARVVARRRARGGAKAIDLAPFAAILATEAGTASPAAGARLAVGAASGLGAQMGGLMGDAPFCDLCGHITVRNGACYKCLNCGNSIGCS